MRFDTLGRLRSRKAIIAVSAAVLVWLVISHSVAAFLADAAPRAALWLDPHQPDALVNLADAAMKTANVPSRPDAEALAGMPRLHGTAEDNGNSGSDAFPGARTVTTDFEAFERVGASRSISRPIAPKNASAVRQWTKTALNYDPLNSHALRILGQLAESGAEDPQAYKFMHAADRLSLHESLATYWLMRNSMEHKDYPSAIRYADILLRAEPLSYSYVVPFLAQICEDKEGAALVEAVLARDPPWRTRFITSFPGDVADARTPLNLLLALRHDPVPLTAADIEPYIRLLIAHKFYSLAYYTWLQFLPPEELRHAGLLFNGSFEESPSGLPFDWTIQQGTGVTIDIVPRSNNGDDHALLIDFQFGRVEYHSVTELVMLPPGTYKFSGIYQGKLVGPRGMKWRVVCVNGALTSGGESPMITGSTKNWATVSFTFMVPAENCSAQHVELDLDARMASEEIVSGSIMFDDLEILRASIPTPPPLPGGSD